MKQRTYLSRQNTMILAVTADVEPLFCFSMPQEFCFRDVDEEKELIEYSMKKHVFGNSVSIAVATLGLIRTIEKQQRGRLVICV